METNFLVIGSGISGLNFALNAAKKGKVTIITKKKLIDSNTNFAQGGIAAVLDKTDNESAHIEDTLKAGSNHNKKNAVKFMIKNSAQAIYHLIDLGVEFEKENGELMLTKEGGHNNKRIAYVGDYTGKEIEHILIKRVKQHPNITIFENTFALDLIITKNKCYGCTTIKRNKIIDIYADQTVIATGGVGQLFKYTTNPIIATGDGIAMGIRAGIKTKDIEFIQFHPTALDKNISPKFLISETVRGEGAKLINEKGESFMDKIHEQKQLAPRDIVAREIFKQLKTGKVYLDIRHKKKEYLIKRFPQIYAKLKQYGFKMEQDLIPITPAAHYICGGLVTDLHGKTKIKNLFAFGEVSYTGVHGANRLASNSLLEALVFSNQILKNLKPTKEKNKIATKKYKLTTTKFSNSKIKEIMWNYCGIIRDIKEIKKIAIPKIQNIIKELNEIEGTNQNLAESRNMAQVGLKILITASKRRKSIGCHFTKN